jgi:lipoprotein-anchoring transpeptidase ErfK/SrfK
MSRTPILVVLTALLVASPAASEPFQLAKARRKPAPTHRPKGAAPHHRRRAPSRPKKAPIDFDAVNSPRTTPLVTRGSSGSATLRAQVLLDRARFSPGEIDAVYATNLEKAVAGFQKARGVQPTGIVDPATWKLLNADSAPVLVRYAIRPEDVAGPFEEVPEDMMEKAKLPALRYASPLEGISEKFHSSPKLLTRLNPGKSFDKAGEEIVVAGVRSEEHPPRAAKVVVRKSDLTVTAYDANDKPLAQYPATMGSEHDPLPIGNWKVNGVSKNPPFHYNPDLFWDADAKDEKTTIQPGPNNPVGVVWIDLSKSHYGIHGTPEPSTIGKTQSHGCIRLTNWDAKELSEMVAPGTPAILEE